MTKWTTDPPTEAGWWWWRRQRFSLEYYPALVAVDGYATLPGRAGRYPVVLLGGEWGPRVLGPVEAETRRELLSAVMEELAQVREEAEATRWRLDAEPRGGVCADVPPGMTFAEFDAQWTALQESMRAVYACDTMQAMGTPIQVEPSWMTLAEFEAENYTAEFRAEADAVYWKVSDAD